VVTRRVRPRTAVALVASAALLVGGWIVGSTLWRFATGREDLLPGRAPDVVLRTPAPAIRPDRLRFAVVGDNGTGGRNAMRVGRAMADAYRDQPFSLLVHTGDLVYYGDLDARYDEVFVRPLRPLLDAGVRVRPVLGNHEFDYTASLRLLERLGLPGRYYSFRAGPAEFFMLDSTPPEFGGDGGAAQLSWLEDRLRRSTARWQIAVLHHPPYSSGRRRPGDLVARAALEPLFVEHGVDLVLTGHDHHYERTAPQAGITYIVAGSGAKLTDVGRSSFTASSAKRLHFLLIDVDSRRLSGRAVDSDGHVFDEFELSPR
jgi:predicted phosphodiesterase